jgi:hypothetical protein
VIFVVRASLEPRVVSRRAAVPCGRFVCVRECTNRCVRRAAQADAEPVEEGLSADEYLERIKDVVDQYQKINRRLRKATVSSRVEKEQVRRRSRRTVALWRPLCRLQRHLCCCARAVAAAPADGPSRRLLPWLASCWHKRCCRRCRLRACACSSRQLLRDSLPPMCRRCVRRVTRVACGVWRVVRSPAHRGSREGEEALHRAEEPVPERDIGAVEEEGRRTHCSPHRPADAVQGVRQGAFVRGPWRASCRACIDVSAAGRSGVLLLQEFKVITDEAAQDQYEGDRKYAVD